MGIIISRFRKQKTTKEKLKSLVKDIKEIEEFRQYTQKRQRDIVGRFVLFSVLIFITAAIGFYFWALPEKTVDRVLYMIPFIFTPFFIVFLKRIITWYYSRKIRRNEDRLTKLQDEKKKLLEDVMDNETYKNAKEILEQFAPEQLRSKESASMIVPRSATRPGVPGSQPGGPQMSAGSQDVRRRILAVPPQQQQQAPTPGWKALPPPSTPITPFQQQRPGVPPGPPMPRTVLPRERGVMDRLVEFIVGDGPSNRYALVCRQCASHNGMALQEEFEYLAFRCCYCYAWNPARKQRPQAPRLPISAVLKQDEGGESSPSTSETEGDETETQEKREGEDESQTDKQPEEEAAAETVAGHEDDAPLEGEKSDKELVENLDEDSIPQTGSIVIDKAEEVSTKSESSS